MANTINSIQMGLPIPTVGVDPGPDYATNINNSLLTIDAHDHTPGKGAPITPGSMSINGDLPMQNNSLTSIKALTLTAQTAFSAASSIYSIANDLYYNDGTGAVIRLTQNGAITGTPGSISGLASPATASFVSASGTFVFQSAVNTAANVDAQSVLFRNATANSYALTLSAPAAMGANYSLVLPAKPTAQKIMTLDASGNMAAPYTVDGSTIAINANVIGVPAGGIGKTQLASPIGTSVIKTSTGSWTVPAGANLIQIIACGGGGGGRGGDSGVNGGAGGQGGGGAPIHHAIYPCTPGSTINFTIGGGGSGGIGGNNGNGSTGAGGQPGGATVIGAAGLFPGVTTYGGSGGANGGSSAPGGGGGSGGGGGYAGSSSPYSPGGNGSGVNGGGGSGGGGGGSSIGQGGTGGRGGDNVGISAGSYGAGGGGGAGGNSSFDGGSGASGGPGWIQITVIG